MTGRDEIKKLLNRLRAGEISTEEALDKLGDLPFKDLGHSKVDNHRELRTGYPEVIFCQGKTPEQVSGIMEYMASQNINILGTRASVGRAGATALQAGRRPAAGWTSPRRKPRGTCTLSE